MITDDGFFTWAIKDPGPAARWKHFVNARTRMEAIYHHSQEGTFNAVSSTGFNVMKDVSRFPTAWHWTVLRDGRVFQHFPVFARLQHAAGGNVIGPGGESEGFAGEDLTDRQVEAWLRIHRDMAAFTGNTYLRSTDGKTGLAEHRQAPGAATACPSERYVPLWKAVAAELEDKMALTEEQIRKIAREEAKAELEAQTAAAGAGSLQEFLRFVSARFFAIHRGTKNPDNAIARINAATDPDATVAEIDSVNR